MTITDLKKKIKYYVWNWEDYLEVNKYGLNDKATDWLLHWSGFNVYREDDKYIIEFDYTRKSSYWLDYAYRVIKYADNNKYHTMYTGEQIEKKILRDISIGKPFTVFPAKNINLNDIKNYAKNTGLHLIKTSMVFDRFDNNKYDRYIIYGWTKNNAFMHLKEFKKCLRKNYWIINDPNKYIDPFRPRTWEVI